ncbi:transcriptional regulator [Burkholderia sp. WAC0059]|nr:PhaM family polyhydroxyalkanoate granule multifunctional regulatory protein [Burkholderia sp. WAC0059]PLZ03480.1 transcriptional regulator [Burkholderia sp. WAC0059]
MTDPAGTQPPFSGFPGFPGFPPADMLERMWTMLRFTPFGNAFPGAQPGSVEGFGASLSAMSDMMAPLTSVEELDKRITDLRAVEQWLKLNLNMLQSAIQTLEVQRSTLATLRAFGAFAQAQMTSADERAAVASGAGASAGGDEARGAAQAADESSGQASAQAGLDASAWWNLLQAQFNQLAQFAMAQPAESPGAGASGASGEPAAPKAPAATTAGEPGATGTAGDDGPPRARQPAPAAKRASARTAPRAAKKAPPRAN